ASSLPRGIGAASAGRQRRPPAQAASAGRQGRRRARLAGSRGSAQRQRPGSGATGRSVVLVVTWEVMVVHPVACLKDNYAYLIHEEGREECVVVDPSEPGPVREALRRLGLRLVAILNTH